MIAPAGGVCAPRVSFIVPAYNAARTITDTLDSLQRQTLPDWEAVIVDDGSRDGTARLVRKAAAHDPRLRLIRQRNAGASAARNSGIAVARGACIAFLDADDWIEPDFLETLLPLTRDGRAIAYCAYRRILPSGRPGPVDWCPELGEDAFAVLVQRCEPAIHCLIIPRLLLLSVGGFDTSLRTCEDWDLWLRLARTGISFVGVPRALAHYRMRAASLSTSTVADDARHVVARAAMPDPRVPVAAAGLAQGWRDAPDARLARAIGAALAGLRAGQALRADWLAQGFGADWRTTVRADPGQFVREILNRLADLPACEADPVLDAVVASLRPADAAIAALVADQCDLARARRDVGTSPVARGRWLALPVSGRALPRRIEPPPGCDALLLHLTDPALRGRDVILPLDRTVTRAVLAAALIDALSLADLAKGAGVWRSARFALHVLRAMAGSGAILPRSRAHVGSLVRYALARHLGAAPPRRTVRALPGEVPILLFDRITAHDAPLLSPAIGQDQLIALLTLLAEEGHVACSLADLAAARRGQFVLPKGAIVVVLGDAGAVHRLGLLARLPEAIGMVEVLFTPDEIAAGLPDRLSASSGVARVRAGMRVHDLPLAVVEALSLAQGWRRALALANREVSGIVAVSSDLDGLADAVLAKAGFDFVLSAGGSPARVDLFGPVVPVIACSGSEAIGDAIESLRPAA